VAQKKADREMASLIGGLGGGGHRLTRTRLSNRIPVNREIFKVFLRLWPAFSGQGRQENELAQRILLARRQNSQLRNREANRKEPGDSREGTGKSRRFLSAVTMLKDGFRPIADVQPPVLPFADDSATPTSCGVTVHALESGVLRVILLVHVRGCGATLVIAELDRLAHIESYARPSRWAA
jgi:hypothetical protein